MDEQIPDPYPDEQDQHEQYLEERLKHEISEYYRRRYPHLRHPRIDPNFDYDFTQGDK